MDSPLSPQHEVVVVGGGAAGSAAALTLGRLGVRTALVDLHAVYPEDFRADKVAGDQLDLMRRLGIFDAVVAKSVRLDRVVNTRGGQVVDRRPAEEYGLPYEDLVNAIRPLIPSSVERRTARVAAIEASDDLQRVVLSGGETLTARLVILATGGGEALKRKAGIERRVLRAAHSVSVGFDLAPAGGSAFPWRGLACCGDGAGDGVDYVSLFPFQRAMRANVFVYRDPKDPWLKALRADPQETLFRTLPGFERHLGPFEVLGEVRMRPTDLYESTGHVRPGVALVGDAFRSVCPAVGAGLSKAFTDVLRLCAHHIPHWLASPGMGADKIAAFYDDPVKRARDDKAAHDSEYRRSVTMDASLSWTLHRRRIFMQRRLRGWLSEMTGRAEAA